MLNTKIEYTINNFSGLINIKDFSLRTAPTQKKGVYFLYSKDEKLLYVGKSVNCIRQRLRNHLIIENPDTYNDTNSEHILKKRKCYEYFAFSEIDINFIDAVERFLIFTKKPNHNLEFKYKDRIII